MSFALSITVSGTGADVPAQVVANLAPEVAGPVAGRAAVNLIRRHLFTLNGERANSLGGRRTSFYAGAGRATSFAVRGDTVVVSINQRGIAQRYFGGTIRPKTKKFLTIPAHPDAHGKRAGEFGALELVFGAQGQAIGLARREPGRAFGEILFRLVRSVTQRPDPTVLPAPTEIRVAAGTAVVSTLRRRLAGPGATPPAP